MEKSWKSVSEKGLNPVNSTNKMLTSIMFMLMICVHVW